MLIAGVAMAASGLLFAAFRAETSTALMFTGYVLFGLGFGMVNAPVTNTAVSGMPRSQAGVAAAIASTSRQTGSTLGVAVAGAVLAAGLARGSDFAGSAAPAWWIITVCGLLVLVVGAASSGQWARSTAERTARTLDPAGARVPAAPRASEPGH